jgi:glutathione S-transferase
VFYQVEDGTPDQIYVRRSLNGGVTWQPPTVLHTAQGYNIRLAVAGQRMRLGTYAGTGTEEIVATLERVLARSGGPYLLGRRLSYVDLSLFQIVEGLRYAFPKRMKRMERSIPRVVALHDRVAKRPRIAAYLASKRRIPFSQWGIYRYFKELDS